jgi:hypothetical protein
MLNTSGTVGVVSSRLDNPERRGVIGQATQIQMLWLWHFDFDHNNYDNWITIKGSNEFGLFSIKKLKIKKKIINIYFCKK